MLRGARVMANEHERLIGMVPKHRPQTLTATCLLGRQYRARRASPSQLTSKREMPIERRACDPKLLTKRPRHWSQADP